jgi:glutamate-1-semialdehyde 2,1-aminomutase
MASEDIKQAFIINHPESQKLHKRAERTFSADGATHGVRILDPFRPYVTHAQGSRKWDVDDSEYIDYVMGHGTLILGHSHPDVVRAVQEQVARGVHYGENHESEVEWAELIKSMMPAMERVEFFSCGQESNMMAIRLARIFTGRKKVIRFAGNFHGWGDELSGPGASGTVADHVEVIPMHDLGRVEKELANKECAILMVEGGGASMGGQVPWDADFVRALRPLTSKYGTILLIDEVVTGFRDSPGGWQSTIGVTPDLTSLGKVIGGGLGAGALGGRANIMDVLRRKANSQPLVRHSGTWNANPLTSAAGVAACKLYVDGKVQKKVNELSALFRGRGNQALKEAGIDARLYGRSIVHMYLGPIEQEPTDDTLPPTKDFTKLMAGAAAKQRLCLHLLHRGIATMAGRLFIFSTAHTDKDIEQTVAALHHSLEAMLGEGSLNQSITG